VSVRLRGAPKFGTKAEVKNLNSFRYLTHALEYEIERQIGVLESGGTVTQETRLWNVAAGRTEPMRSKEFAHDYRYFPDPDLLPVAISDSMIQQVREEMPELPAAKLARFLRDYGITAYDAGVLTASRALADYFEAAVKAGAPGKTAANWIGVELLRRLNDAGKSISECPLPATALAELLKKVSGKRRNHGCQWKKSVRENVRDGEERRGHRGRGRAGANQRCGRDRENRARSYREKPGQRGQVSQRERRRFQVFRGPSDARDAGAGQPAVGERSTEARALGVLKPLEYPEKKVLNEGDQAPDFHATADDGRTISLGDYRGKNLILYFFPKANTPG
jgi:hypothetical protein